ncbi:hypothetical protein ABFS82_11G003500 [Erythranthe guttata]|uniref:protein-serine/threonine phosphatase n=1 Tax=Erythranthe guttata TaxID=4155 RepID=A0A022Q2E7_ERYGU|nr:PREDICTED: probable protein phosphatase 2C 43 [Erythranthe guttata]XP_012857261.1 PREDICTED: probable protein phosphatase 2C 43 [Erythranthe guttata]EYU20690.1 hypothetical protein MIMGU_mgv1a008267mg [Erythranthe guttata]|eukprot:XP_012857260.1 PREDICTED: probable protein phosphatase 2C 43 [Erythranthe guttata]
MCSWLGRSVSTCLRPFSRYARMNRDDDEGLGSDDDALLWSRDLEKHSNGEFSFAVVQANEVLEDHSQVETGRHATFIGVYDGHGGPEAARYISDHMFNHLLRLAQENGMMSEDILRNATSETENGFLTLVRRAYTIRPTIAAVGSCCLVGVIWKGTLYIANLGDSRAVMGYMDRSNKIVAEQLTRDHNACMDEVRKELKTLHPEDSQILVMKQGVWRVKGIIQVSRSIGDAYLKRPEFALDPSFPRFHLTEPLRRPVLRADPAIFTRNLQTNDKFVIFASDGLWEHLTNQEAVQLVHNHPRVGIARRLVISALSKAAKTRQISFNEIKKLDKGVRRHIHDDITVVVIFIDREMMDKKNSAPELSVRGFVDTVGPSTFNF